MFKASSTVVIIPGMIVLLFVVHKRLGRRYGFLYSEQLLCSGIIPEYAYVLHGGQADFSSPASLVARLIF
jgi:hypothetical protein